MPRHDQDSRAGNQPNQDYKPLRRKHNPPRNLHVAIRNMAALERKRKSQARREAARATIDDALNKLFG